MRAKMRASRPGRFKEMFEALREKHPSMSRKHLRMLVRKQLANNYLSGLSYVSEQIKKRHGVIMSRRERRKLTSFMPFYN